MKPNRVLVYLATFAFGVAAGVFAHQYVYHRIQQEAAKANLLLAGESLRKRDLVAAMAYAQSAAAEAPYAYSPYEAIGDVYVQFGLTSAARSMYQKAIDRLTSESEGAMLVARGAVSPQKATDLVRRKVNSLPSADWQPPEVKDRS